METDTLINDTITDPFTSQFQTLLVNVAAQLRQGKDPRELAADTYAAISSLIHAESRPESMGLGALAGSYWEQIKQFSNAAPTTFPALDKFLGGGLLPGRLMALLGAPGVGKSSFSCQVAENIASYGRPVLYITSEDTPHMLLCRSMARLTGLNYGALLRGHISDSEYKRALAAMLDRPSAERMQIVEHAGAFDLAAIRELARQHFTRFSAENAQGGGPGLLIIDYLQRLARATAGAAGQDLRQAVTALTERLRDVARDLGCTVMVLSAQGRESYKNGGSGSTLGTAKESGDIEYCCDVLAAIVPADDRKRTEAAHGHDIRLLRVDKNRQGQVGAIYLDWEGALQTFVEVGD